MFNKDYKNKNFHLEYCKELKTYFSYNAERNIFFQTFEGNDVRIVEWGCYFFFFFVSLGIQKYSIKGHFGNELILLNLFKILVRN